MDFCDFTDKSYDIGQYFTKDQRVVKMNCSLGACCVTDNVGDCGSDLLWLLYGAPHVVWINDSFVSPGQCIASQAYRWMWPTEYTTFLGTWRSLFFKPECSLWSWILCDCKHWRQYRKSILKPSYPSSSCQNSPEEMRENPHFRKDWSLVLEM